MEPKFKFYEIVRIVRDIPASRISLTGKEGIVSGNE